MYIYIVSNDTLLAATLLMLEQNDNKSLYT
jgi:hypothetical protein